MSLTFSQLRRVNVERCQQSFFQLDHWTPADWMTALAGEVGEAANLLKKLRRIQDGDTPYARHLTAGHSMHPEVVCGTCGDLDGCHVPAKLRREQESINDNIGAELADVIVYADLLAARLGIDLEAAVRDKFNEVSKRVGSELKL